MKKWKGNVTNSAYDAEGKFYLADEADAEIGELTTMLKELRKLQDHDALFSPDELHRMDALIAKHKGE